MRNIVVFCIRGICAIFEYPHMNESLLIFLNDLYLLLMVPATLQIPPLWDYEVLLYLYMAFVKIIYTVHRSSEAKVFLKFRFCGMYLASKDRAYL